MQRLTMLITICLFTVLFCFIAGADHRLKDPPDHERDELPATDLSEKQNHPVEKRVLLQKARPPTILSFLREGPDPGESQTDDQDYNDQSARPAEKQNPAAVEKLTGKTKVHYPKKQQDRGGVHFLLIGRWWEEPAPKVLMMVTLVPGGCAWLTALDPAVRIERDGTSCPLAQALEQEDGYGRLCLAAQTLTGLEPQFYIDFNLHGFVKMISLLQSDNCAGTLPRTSPHGGALDGNEMLLLLSDASISIAVKEELLVQLLLTACEIQFTRLGLELLWMGYQNLKTDLSLKDLLEIRKITQGIAPTNVTFTEVAPEPGPRRQSCP